MSHSHSEWEELGRSVQEIVDRAVSSQDYEKLNRTIRQVVETAVDLGGEAVRRAKAGASEQRQRVTQEQKNPALLYAGTTGKVVGSIAKIVGGSVLTALSLVGLISMFVLNMLTNTAGALSMIIPLVFMGGGGAFLGSGVAGLARMNRFKAYRTALGAKTYCSLEKLAGSVKKSVKFVRKELRGMIDDGLFLEGHLDKEEQNLITSHATYRYFEQSRLQLEQRRQAEQLRQEQISTLGADVQDVLRRGDEFIARIRRCNDRIPGEEISEKISRIELIVQRIFDRAESCPEIVPDLKRMMDYYLPMTVKLLEAYAEMDEQPAKGDNILASMKEIEQTLDTLNLSFEKLLDELFEDTALDISSDISVLNTMLAQEGLKEDELTKMKKERSI